jgi:hypothetical protein
MEKQPKLKTITLFMGGHGCEVKPDTEGSYRRSSNLHNYDDLTVNFLSFAGYANIPTESGLVFERKESKKQTDIITKIAKSGLDKYKLFNAETASQLEGEGTDDVTLSYIVPHIFKDRSITTQSESRSALEVMKSEMLAVGMLAALKYSDTSPPEIATNPTFEKMWWYDDKPGDDRRRFDTTARTGPSRAKGFKKHNPILSTNGLFILDTTIDEHKPFSISDIHQREFISKGGLSLISPNDIRRRNLLRKINYTSYWKKWIEAFDFSHVRDDDVLKIDSVIEAVFIVKQIYYALFHSANATDNNPNDRYEVADTIDEEDAELGDPVTIGPQEPPPPPEDIIEKLKDIIRNRESDAHTASGLNVSIQKANHDVQYTQANILRTVDATNQLEEFIEQREKEKKAMTLRSDAKQQASLTGLLSAAEEELRRLRTDLDQMEATLAELESQLELIKGKIISDVTDFILYLISQPEPEVKNTIKNIIMRNKLKNILKIGIFHKRLTLSQIIIFFRSLGYEIINIVDPSCFVLKAATPIKDPPSTQDMDDSQTGVDKPEPTPPTHWSEELADLAKLLADGPGRRGGGTKRKKSKYSRKRRTRRKRCVTRRFRRRRS